MSRMSFELEIKAVLVDSKQTRGIRVSSLERYSAAPFAIRILEDTQDLLDFQLFCN